MDRLILAKAFNEWMRRYIDEPARFQAEFRTVAAFVAEETAGNEPAYGRECTAYLEKLCAEVGTTPPVASEREQGEAS